MHVEGGVVAPLIHLAILVVSQGMEVCGQRKTVNHTPTVIAYQGCCLSFDYTTKTHMDTSPRQYYSEEMSEQVSKLLKH